MAQDPLITNNFIDGCSYSPADPGELAAANDILARTLDGQFQLGIPHAARAELDHPNTPAQTKRVAANQMYLKPVPLTPPEQKVQAEIHRILTGVGKPDAMWRDAQNIFEAQKYGCGHFITNDKKVLARAKDVYRLCGLSIVTPTEFLAVVLAGQARA